MAQGQENLENPKGTPVSKDVKTPEAPDTVDLDHTLSDGRTFKIKRLKGKDVMEAQKIVGDNSEKFQTAYMAQSIEMSDNSIILMEDLEEWWGEDYLKIMAEFAKVNFTLVQKT